MICLNEKQIDIVAEYKSYLRKSTDKNYSDSEVLDLIFEYFNIILDQLKEVKK